MFPASTFFTINNGDNAKKATTIDNKDEEKIEESNEMMIKKITEKKSITFFDLSPQMVIDDFFLKRREAEDNREKENKSAVIIQKAYKRYVARKAYVKILSSVCLIQRMLRGFLYGRIVKRKLLLERKQQEREAFYHYCATLIQKTFRGYMVRKYVHNFNARKEYLRFIEYKNQETNDFIEQYKSQRAQEIEIEREEKELEEFQKISRSLHHLVSTKAIPGVYKSIHQTTSEETVYGVPIEEQLRYVAKSDYINSIGQKKTKSSLNSLRSISNNTTIEIEKNPSLKYLSPDQLKSSSKKSKETAETLKLPPINKNDMMRTKPRRNGPFKPEVEVYEAKNKLYEKSIQNSTTYEHEKELKSFEKYIEKKTRITSNDFIVKKTPPLSYSRTVNTSDPFQPPVRSILRDNEIEKRLNGPFKPSVNNSTTGVFDKFTIPFVPTATPNCYNNNSVSCSSIAKALDELVKNSIDANASRIEIILDKESSIELQVQDNGTGIGYKDLKILGEKRNVTSYANDKTTHNGQALHSICQMSSMEIISKVGTFPYAYKKVFQRGKMESLSQVPCTFVDNKGTKITCKDFFYNMPVRRKQLSGLNIVQEIKTIVEKYSFCFTNISFSLVIDSKLVLLHKLMSPSNNEGDLISLRMMKEEKNKIVINNYKIDNVEINGVISIEGNGPLKLVFFNNKLIDVNLDSLYLEFVIKIKGEESMEVKSIRETIKRVLNRHLPCPSPSSEVFPKDEDRNPPVETTSTKTSLFEKLFPSSSRTKKDKSFERLSVADLLEKAKANTFQYHTLKKTKHDPCFDAKTVTETFCNVEPNDKVNLSIQKEQIDKLEVVSQFDRKFIITKLQSKEEGLNIVAVDQHACDERIRVELFEKRVFDYLNNGPGEWIKQIKIAPNMTIKNIAEKDYELVEKFQLKLSKWFWDFNFERLEGGHKILIIKAVPSIVIENEVIQLTIEDMINYARELENDNSSWYPKYIYTVINSKACRGAIMFGDTLSINQCKELLNNLSKCNLPFQCAHGRPTMTILKHLKLPNASIMDNNLQL